MKLNGKPFDISVLQIYAQISDTIEEETEEFYVKLDQAMAYCKFQEVIIAEGDFNAKVESERSGEVVGPHGLGETNEREMDRLK